MTDMQLKTLLSAIIVVSLAFAWAGGALEDVDGAPYKPAGNYEMEGSAGVTVPVYATLTDGANLEACRQLHPDLVGCDKELAACEASQECAALDDNMNQIQPAAGGPAPQTASTFKGE